MTGTISRIGLKAAVILLALGGCASYPERIDELDQARSAVGALERTSRATDEADRQMQEARRYLREAELAYEEQEPVELVAHKAYVAQRYAEIGALLIANFELEREIATAEQSRNQVLLDARERRARLAEEQAAMRLAQAEQAQRDAEISREEAERLQQQLDELEAERTSRGMVLTLDDVLFDTNRAELQPAARSTIVKLVSFMREYPQRELLIEGHTDSTGAADYNEALSGRRAEAVRDALVIRGIDSARIRTVGLGENHPVASNDSSAGRQQNRRVEIVISDESGNFPETAQRS